MVLTASSAVPPEAGGAGAGAVVAGAPPPGSLSSSSSPPQPGAARAASASRTAIDLPMLASANAPRSVPEDAGAIRSGYGRPERYGSNRAALFLTDAELHDLLAGGVISPLAGGFEDDSSRDPIQPSSVDLTIGSIVVPGTAPEEFGSLENRREILSLDPGGTAVVETNETCRFPAHIGAIGFPPASVSAQGLLMTNPGHIDPGYDGGLSFTVINMGRQPFRLARGDRIVTLLLFRLGRDVASDYKKRNPDTPHGRISQDTLNMLSPDFLDVDERATRAASTVELKSRRIGIGIPIVAAIIALGGTYLQTQRANDDEIRQLQQDVKVLDAKLQATR